MGLIFCKDEGAREIFRSLPVPVLGGAPFGPHIELRTLIQCASRALDQYSKIV